jgi:hypothetical protein
MRPNAGAARQEVPAGDPAESVELGRYPIRDCNGPAAQALIAQCCAELRLTGACVLPGFLRPTALVRMADEARLVAPHAHWPARGPGGTAYLEPPDPGFPDGHPRRRLQQSSVGAVYSSERLKMRRYGRLG